MHPKCLFPAKIALGSMPGSKYRDVWRPSGLTHRAALSPNALLWAAFGVMLILLGSLAASAPAAAQSRLAEFLARVPPGELVPGADAYQAPAGAPPVAAVRAGGRTVGYAFVNADWVDSTGYSGKPIEILVGLGVDG